MLVFALALTATACEREDDDDDDDYSDDDFLNDTGGNKKPGGIFGGGYDDGKDEHTHSYGDWETVIEPTCTEDGLKEKRCSCGETKEKIIPATRLHDMRYGVCTMCGKSDASEGLYFEYNSDGTYTLAGLGECTDTVLRIPSTYNGSPVTKIGSYAFHYCTYIYEVIIPDSITEIRDHAFNGCSGLTNVSIPSSIKSVGNAAFNECYNLVYNYYDYGKYLGNDYDPYVVLMEATDCYQYFYDIHYNTKVISDYAMYDCEYVSTISVPGSVITIGDYAFYDCDELDYLIIGSEVEFIGKGVVYYCDDLEEIQFNNTSGWSAYCNDYDNYTYDDVNYSHKIYVDDSYSNAESFKYTTEYVYRRNYY